MVELLIKDKDGRIVKRVAVNEREFNRYVKKMNSKDNMDYSTRWFIRFIGKIFEPAASGGKVSISFTDVGGTARTQNVKYNYSVDLIWSTYNGPVRPWITVGTGSTPPTRDDFKLGNKINEALASLTADETVGVISLSASFVFGSDTTIYEVGLEFECAVLSYTTYNRILFDRTVISDGLTVPAGQTLSVVYKFTL
jgi:hypothetical protein